MCLRCPKKRARDRRPPHHNSPRLDEAREVVSVTEAPRTVAAPTHSATRKYVPKPPKVVSSDAEILSLTRALRTYVDQHLRAFYISSNLKHPTEIQDKIIKSIFSLANTRSLIPEGTHRS